MSKKSRAEQDLFQVLREEYPHAAIICQEPIKCGKKTLFLDYFIPTLKMAFEADGRQHYEFVPFFHRSVSGFEHSVRNDQLKSDWCKQNDVLLIRFSEDEDVDRNTLRLKIKQYLEQKESSKRTRRNSK